MLKNTSLKNYRCPVSRCSGWVVLVADPEERSFWGCGECGSVWYNRSKLFEEICKIINRFPYRQRCYVFDGDTILPNKRLCGENYLPYIQIKTALVSKLRLVFVYSLRQLFHTIHPYSEHKPEISNARIAQLFQDRYFHHSLPSDKPHIFRR